MKNKNPVYTETLYIILGELICVPIMIGLFALAGYFNRSVVLGGVVGAVLTVANFFFMAVTVSIATDRAQDQNVKGGQSLLQISMLLRYLTLFAILFIAAKSKFCHPLALVLPLIFERPILTLSEFFRKAGERKS